MSFIIPKFNKVLRTFSPFRSICAKDYGQIYCHGSFPFYQESRAPNFDEWSAFIQCIRLVTLNYTFDNNIILCKVA